MTTENKTSVIVNLHEDEALKENIQDELFHRLSQYQFSKNVILRQDENDKLLLHGYVICDNEMEKIITQQEVDNVIQHSYYDQHFAIRFAELLTPEQLEQYKN